MATKKYPTMSIRKHANELKVHEKTVRTAIKIDWTPLILLYRAFQKKKKKKKKKCNFPSNISSLKIAIEEEWNKMSEWM